MVAVTYGVAVPTEQAPRKPQSFFARLVASLIESRIRRAEQEMARYRHLLPDELELAGYRVSRRTEDQLPFIR